MTTLACDYRIINLSVRDYTLTPFNIYQRKLQSLEVFLTAIAQWLVECNPPNLIVLFHIPLTIDCYNIQFRFYLDKAFIEYGIKFLEYAWGQPLCPA